jgi:hypothetical protein
LQAFCCDRYYAAATAAARPNHLPHLHSLSLTARSLLLQASRRCAYCDHFKEAATSEPFDNNIVPVFGFSVGDFIAAASTFRYFLTHFLSLI